MRAALDWLREEPRRIWRGISALQRVLGRRFTAALLLTFGLLLWAVLYYRGPLVFVLGLVLVLLAIRAHDLGDEQEPEPSEFETFWGRTQWTRGEQEKMRAQREAGLAAHEFNRLRDSVALGKPHEPREL